MRRASSRFLLATTLIAAFAIVPSDISSAAAAPPDGAWAQLGVPFNLAQATWDHRERRFVSVWDLTPGARDSIENAWEFRESSGWRRIRLPQPPEEMVPAWVTPVPDAAHDRLLFFAFPDGSIDSTRLWALDFGPTPRWELLDRTSSGPSTSLDGRAIPSLETDALWLESLHWYDSLSDIWVRSLADTGTWRFVREQPQSPGPPWKRAIDPSHDRELLFVTTSDSVRVWSLSLTGTSGWTPVSMGSPAPLGVTNLVVVPDSARSRLLVMCWKAYDPSDTPAVEAWACNLGDTLQWEFLGEGDPDLLRPLVGIVGDTLLFGPGGVPGRVDARTVATTLGNPTHARTLAAPSWPPESRGAVLVRDASRNCWLLIGGRPVEGTAYWGSLEFLGGPLDSLWELKLSGGDAEWWHLPVEGDVPVRADNYAWTVDESDGTLYLLNGWNSSSGPPASPLELWALREGEVPGWELVATGRADDWPSPGCDPAYAPALVFDSVRRMLVCFGFRDGQTGRMFDEAWQFDVDHPSGWSRVSPSGDPPDLVMGRASAFDAARSRVVALGWGGQTVILDTDPELRWEVATCSGGLPEACLWSRTGMGAGYDPIGRRMLALGHHDPSWVNIGPGSPLFEVSAGESLGVSRELETLGTPGWQAAPTLGYDADRDALLLFGIRSNGLPILQEYRFHRSGKIIARPQGCAVLPDHIALRWIATPDANLRLWRLAPGDEWVPQADLHVPGSGVLAFDDREIEASIRYGYRLTLATAPYEPASADVWLTATTFPSFSLARPWPNPSRGAFTLAFTLAASASADLEVFDLAGRRVWARRWDALSPGPHHVAISPGDLPRGGLYFVRLRQAGRSATARVIVAP